MKDGSPHPDGLVCRLLQKDDYPEIVELMKKFHISIAGLYSSAVYTAFYRRAIVDDRVVFGVAEYEHKLVGLVIAIIDWNKFWPSFLFRHWLIALRIPFNKLADRLRKSESKPTYDPQKLKDVDQYLTTAIADRSWNDSSPKIAKALYIAVDPNCRGLKIGYRLNRFRDTILIQRGVERYDGWVDSHSIPQLHLLHKTGFLIERRGDKFFVSKDIQPGALGAAR